MIEYVLDTSALLTLFKDEEGAQEVEEILEACGNGRSRAYLPFMSLMEFEYMVLRSRGRTAVDGALRVLLAWPVERKGGRGQIEAWAVHGRRLEFCSGSDARRRAGPQGPGVRSGPRPQAPATPLQEALSGSRDDPRPAGGVGG
jgi:PIN domain